MYPCILITIFLLTKACLVLPTFFIALSCDDDTTIKQFNLCEPHDDGTICEINEETYQNNNRFKIVQNGTKQQTIIAYRHTSDEGYNEASAHTDVTQEQLLQFQCVRYNNTDDDDSTVDKVCSAADINFYSCQGQRTPVELITQEGDDVTLHCSDAPRGSDVQYFVTRNYRKRFLTTGYSISIRNLTSQSAGEYTCVAVDKSSNSTRAYTRVVNLKVQQLFRNAHPIITEREADSVSFKCLPFGIEELLSHVNITKWTVQYTPLSAEHYNKRWSAAESWSGNITLIGLTPSTWYLIKGLVTDSTGKTVAMKSVIFSTGTLSANSTAGARSDTFVVEYKIGQYIMGRIVRAMPGDNVVLECGFNMDHLIADFDLEAKWSHARQELKMENNKYERMNLSLVIKNFSPQDVDTWYACHLKATPKTAQADYTEAELAYAVLLDVSGPMGVALPPVDVQCANRTANSITMTWLDNPRNTHTNGFKVQYWNRMEGNDTEHKRNMLVPKTSQSYRKVFHYMLRANAYWFKIIAVDSIGYKSDSVTKLCETLP